MDIDSKINLTLYNLSKSKFRSNFKLKQNDKEYIANKGMDVIEKHTIDFIEKRLKPKDIPNDGKQTPTKGHPTFIAQHATATCCRKCLYKWHKISENKELTDEEVSYVTKIIIKWIKNNL